MTLDAPLAFGLGRDGRLSAATTSVFDRLGESIGEAVARASGLDQIGESFLQSGANASGMSQLGKMVADAAARASGLDQIGESFLQSGADASGMSQLGKMVADAAARASGLDQIGESFLQSGADASGMSQLGKMVADATARASGLDQIGESFVEMAGLGEMLRLADTFAAPEWATAAMEAVADLRDGGAVEGESATEAGRYLVESAFGPESELTDADRAFVRWYAAVLAAAILFYWSLLLPEAAGLASESVWVVAFGIAVYRATKRKLPPGAA